MGLRGPAPKPTAIKRLQGNPGKRPLNDQEPHFGGTPKPPKHLNARERHWWRVIAESLSSVPDLLTQADWSVLEHLAVHYRIWEEAKAEYDKQPIQFVKDTATGKTIRNPYLVLMQEETGIIDRLRGQLGMSPSNRARIQVGGTTKKPDSPWAATKPIPISKQA